MKLFINSSLKNIPMEIDTIGKLLDYLNITRQGTGVGLNNTLVKASAWDLTHLKDEDRITIISATYGG